MKNNKFEPKLIYKDGKALCILNDGEREFLGEALCHPDDMDMESNKTGIEIALRRAKIKALTAYKRDLKLKLSSLNQLFYSMNRSKKFNPKSYENKMLQRQIRLINFDLDTIKEIIATEKQSLRTYISEKDKFYNKIRSNRGSKKSE